MPSTSSSAHEQTPLLRASLSQGNLSSVFAPARDEDNNERDAFDATSPPASPRKKAQWAASLKRRSAVLSNLLSGNTHSGGWEPLLASGESGEEDSGDATSVRRMASGGAGTGQERKLARGYDGEFRAELAGEGGNGVRQWYDNYVTIDWQHDAIKASMRQRKLRHRMQKEGLRGWLANVWDGSQGWLLVTIVGFFSAFFAFAISRSETLLFDLKDGYCSTNPLHSKGFCCPSVTPDVTISTYFTSAMNTSAGLLSTAAALKSECRDWRTWGQVWSGTKAGREHSIGDIFAVDYVVYILVALALATISSFLTVTLSSSASVYSSKDHTSAPHPGFAPDFPAYGSTSDGDLADSQPLPAPRPRKVMYFAAGSGIPEVKTILAGFVIRGYLGSWTLFTKAVGLTLSVASGLNLGKEGPMVHIASCIGNVTSRFFPKYDRNEGKRREILSAACAAGVAVSFGAPVGGTLFSLEEASTYFPPQVMIRSFWCAMIAAVTLKLLNPFGTGKTVLFAVTYDRDWSTFELVGFLALGVFGGVYGALFCKANIWWTRHVRNGTFFRTHPIFEVACITFVTVIVSFFNPFTKMGGGELVFELFSECHREDSFSGLCVARPELAWKVIGSVAFALVAKALLTVATFGIKLPAGIFIPTLGVGACAGRIAGLLVEIVHAKHPEMWVFEACRSLEESGPLPFGQACVIPGVWALVGAAAALAGVTRTVVSLAVIMFELTGSLTYTIPVMLSVLIARSVADAIEPRSIYDLVIELNDLPYLDAKQEFVHEHSPLDICDDEAPVISLDDENTVHSLRSKLAQLYHDGSGGGFPIVAKEDGGFRLFGYIAAKELEHGLAISMPLPSKTPCAFTDVDGRRKGAAVPVVAGLDFSPYVDRSPVTVNPRSPMELLHELFSKLGCRYLLLVDERGFFLGPVEKNRYLKYLSYTEKMKHVHPNETSEEGKGPHEA